MSAYDKNNFVVIRGAVDKKVVDVTYKYFINKRRVADYFFKNNIKIYSTVWGSYDDDQAPNTYCVYGDLIMETHLVMCLPIIEQYTNKRVVPTYSYARLYKKGDVLIKHKDRFSCEISTTLNLGGDGWAIYIEPDENKKAVEVILQPGDMMIYKGSLCNHWRDSFQGEICGQVFLHYNNKETKDAEKNIFDGRSVLGLPINFKGERS